MAWYKDGLYFKCHKNCSKCCTGSPGYVWLTTQEIDKIAKFLKIPKENFLKTFTRSIKGKISLKENFSNFDCCFLKDKKCQIYEARPKQCKTFPFWKSNLQSQRAWQFQKKHCPGIDDTSGKLYPEKEIEKLEKEDSY
ncbi:MAG: hypothetical protein KR126chlam6_00764 [Candidatus Anoxychlamydiales bacterium]|nr:hypothetical protein [Candidatus Anoxychlamydiales bacterium]